jgi:hypothetical protein
MQLRPDWSRPLPQTNVIPTVTTLRTLADVRALIQCLPEDHRDNPTWRHVAAQLERAAVGVEVVDLGIAHSLALSRRERRRFSRCKCVDRESEIGWYVAREARADKFGSRDRGSQLALRELNAIVCGWSVEAGVIYKALPRLCPVLTQPKPTAAIEKLRDCATACEPPWTRRIA